MMKIIGPCSAESYEQLERTFLELKGFDITAFRAGVWKPRTKPGSFEGNGEKALQWLQKLKEKHNIPLATEVSNKEHVKLALKYDIDYLWIGARTSGNPFLMSELATALKDTEKTVLVKNPLHPDLSLWLGGINRLEQIGIKNIVGIFRGFHSYHKGKYRNQPLWQVLLDFKYSRPDLKIIVDPSHIAGESSLVKEVFKESLAFDPNGYMIETHCKPSEALSDAGQQLTPNELVNLLESNEKHHKKSNETLEAYRRSIDVLDKIILETLNQRKSLVEKIGEYKKENDMDLVDPERYVNLLKSRTDDAVNLGLDGYLINKIFSLIHSESVERQRKLK